MLIRPATSADLSAIEQIQAGSPEASHWPAGDYLRYDAIVAIEGDAVVGFLVSRELGDEREILNVAVLPDARRRGIAAALLEHELLRGAAAWFLEVRESNAAARRLYSHAGFRFTGTRNGYYDDPPESAIVMTFHS